MKRLLIIIAALAASRAAGQTQDVTAVVTGTLRTKVEWQPGEKNARFDVRTARLGVGGKAYGLLDYKMEIDLSDEGKIKMVDAWVGGRVWRNVSVNMGYMRVPFTIDAHRSPHLQLFANRSFIAKQVGNVRDVGATIGWKPQWEMPFIVQMGMFNGSGLVDGLQKYWTKSFNYSTKIDVQPIDGVRTVAGFQTTKPATVRIHMWDAAASWTGGRWMVEGEYLRKNYERGTFAGVNSVNAMAVYGIPIDGKLKKLSFLGRWDYLDDHSNGIPDAAGNLIVNDPSRHRLTAGTTFSLGLPFEADIRLNFEKYFYKKGVTPGLSDHNKIVVELMVHF